MEDINSLTDSMVLDYLNKNARFAVAKKFAKEKNIDIEKFKKETEVSTTLKDVVHKYTTSLKAAEKSKFITSTPKPAPPQKPEESSSSSDDSDDEADSDDQDTAVAKTEKKKLLTKSRKKNSGINCYFLLF